jgi:hypothetical protein
MQETDNIIIPVSVAKKDSIGFVSAAGIKIKATS